MVSGFISRVSLFLIILFTPFATMAWGFWAHQRINRMAIFLLPEPMFGFFKFHIDYVTAHAVDPDKRRYAVEGEAAHHFIDLDRYGEHPLDSVPRRWADAISKYSEDTLIAHGVVPWHIVKVFYRLVNAFEKNDAGLILKYASDLGHYIGDAHVPLHCTRNYNGQLTGQDGIHGFWESRIPELFGDGYDYVAGPCELIGDPLSAAWSIISDSYAAHDSVLSFEKLLSTRFPADRKYAYVQKGNLISKNYSIEYSREYDRLLGGMSERRMRESIRMVASFWYSAWVFAGQPELNIIAGSNEDEYSGQELVDPNVKIQHLPGHSD